MIGILNELAEIIVSEWINIVAFGIAYLWMLALITTLGKEKEARPLLPVSILALLICLYLIGRVNNNELLIIIGAIMVAIANFWFAVVVIAYASVFRRKKTIITGLTFGTILILLTIAFLSINL